MSQIDFQTYAKLIDGAIEFAPEIKDGIIYYNHNVEQMLKDGYKPYFEDAIPATNRRGTMEIEETDEAIYQRWVWQETEEECQIRLLKDLRSAKLEEAAIEAYAYIANDAVFELDNGLHIEATTDNISKIGLQVVELYIAGDTQSSFPWNTKEDINIELTIESGKYVVDGLKAIQSKVWTIDYPNYLQQIKAAKTIEELNAIVIDYSK